MTPDLVSQYRADLARSRAERRRFAKLAADRRRESAELKKRGQWVDALKARDRAYEYRQSRDQYADEVKRIQELLRPSHE